MIYINLLPPELVPRQRNVLPYVAVAALAVVLTVWLVGARLGVSAGRPEKKSFLVAVTDAVGEPVAKTG